MEWIKYTIQTDIAHEDEAVGALLALGIDAIEICDNTISEESIEKEGGFYEELMPDVDTANTGAEVIFYLEKEDDSLIEELENLISDYGSISRDVSDEKDWRDNWKKYFHSFTIGDFLIRPSWEEPEGDYDPDKTIVIDPGIAFGTGSHESTRLCISSMQNHINSGDKVFDVGFGSGILSVTALKLKAASVTGTDIDSDCLISCRDNFEKNGLDYEKASFFIGDISSDKDIQEKVGTACYDVVLANLLADIIIGMKDRLADAIKPGGLLIASGIIDFKEEEVRNALGSVGLEIEEINHDGEWVQITAKKPL